jgi:hypothetical protein
MSTVSLDGLSFSGLVSTFINCYEVNTQRQAHSTLVLRKLTVIPRNSLPFTVPVGSLPYPQHPTTGQQSQQNESG